MDTLFARQQHLLALTSTEHIRSLMYEIKWDKRLLSIRGSRGVGKTTLILQYIKLNYPITTREALYCSLDSIYFSNHTLVELASQFQLTGGKRLFLDEVHKYDNWSREVKEIYDSFPELKVVISGSSLLKILNADADLSRRCRPYLMHGLSFVEYLEFYHDLRFPSYPLNELLENAGDICIKVNQQFVPIREFRNYLQAGYYPFFDGEDREEYNLTIENIINFIIDQEIPLLRGIEPGQARKIKALLRFCASSKPYEVDITRLGRLLELSRPSVLNYLNALNDAQLLNLLYADVNSIKKLQKPDKIYIQNNNLLQILSYDQMPEIGTARETFAVQQLMRRHRVEYGKQHGDFLVDGKWLFEVGGPDKSFSQIADIPNSYVLSDDLLYPIGAKLPLWLIGLEK
ncbi:MAG: AAA family ATPase [Bacteroidales bacterium]|nr:AAA family ATPase [Bacteroidales bacterium]